MGVKVREKVKDSGVFWIFVNHNGRRTSRLVGSLKAAEKAKEQIEARLTLDQWLPEEKTLPTVQEYYDQVFLPVYIDTAVAQSTAASYVKNFKTHILPALGTRRLNDINHDRMEEFVSDLVKKAPRIRRKKGSAAEKDVAHEETRTLAKATIQTIVKQLCKFFNHARKRKHITDNPASGLSELYSQARAKHEAVEPLTREEVPLFLVAVRERKESRQHYPLFFTAIHTGLREGELAGLQSGDVDINGKYLVVRRSIDRVHRKVVPTKTKRIRRIDLSDELLAVLKDHMRQQKEVWLKREIPEGETRKPQPEWLFPNDEGAWLDMSNLSNRHFKTCLKKAGLHQRRFHDLRHTFASLLLTNGAPIAYVSEQMGHASIQLTVKLYGHLQPGANRHWMNSLPGAEFTGVAVAAD